MVGPFPGGLFDMKANFLPIVLRLAKVGLAVLCQISSKSVQRFLSYK